MHYLDFGCNKWKHGAVVEKLYAAQHGARELTVATSHCGRTFEQLILS